jgi:thioredoxin 1
MAEVQHFDEASFDKAIAGDKPVLVDFWAPWCGPCRMIAPIIEELAKEVGDKAIIGKIDVDEVRELAIRYGITSIPTIKVFKNGIEVDNMLGAAPKEVLFRFLSKHY